MTIAYFLSKFSNEALFIELFLIGCLSIALLIYFFFKRRRYSYEVAEDHIPDKAVRAFLTEMHTNVEHFKNQLYGSDFKWPSSGSETDNEKLNADLAASHLKQKEFMKKIVALIAEKSALEEKLRVALGQPKGEAYGQSVSEPSKSDSDILSEFEKMLSG
jgi:hypothetical protein